MSRKAWKLDKDPMESARKFILKHGNEYQVRLLNMEPLPPGTKALTFQVTDFVELWAENT